LSQVLTSIGLALAGRAGARLASGMAIATSRMTQLRLSALMKFRRSEGFSLT
jgi:hypothetical protein